MIPLFLVLLTATVVGTLIVWSLMLPPRGDGLAIANDPNVRPTNAVHDWSSKVDLLIHAQTGLGAFRIAVGIMSGLQSGTTTLRSNSGCVGLTCFEASSPKV